MIKYAKVVNEDTGLCEVGIGTDSSFYESIGMRQIDVLESEIDNQWYLAEKCPQKTDEEKLADIKNKKRIENKSAYDAKIKNGIAFKETIYDCDDTATIRITGKTLKLTPDEPVLWFDYYCKPQTLSYEEFLALGDIVALNIEKVETKNCAIVNEIENAQTIQDVQAIVINYSEID